MKYQSLQTKLTAIIVAIVLLSLGALGGLNYWKTRQLLFAGSEEKLVDLAGSYAEQVGLWLSGHQSEVTMLAHSTPITSGDINRIVPFLKAVHQANPDYLSLTFIQPDGTFYDSAGFTGNISYREYFQRAIKGKTVITDPLISATVGEPFIAIVEPVNVNGKIIGCFSGVIKLERISQRIAAIKAGQTGYAYVLQGDGLIIIHPNPELTFKNSPLSDPNAPTALKEAMNAMVNGERGISRYSYNGIDKIMAYAPIPGVHWSLAVTVPATEVNEHLREFTMITLLVTCSVLLLSVLASILFARRISRPIKKLESAANQIADGNFAAISPKIKSNDEVGRLGEAFEKMIYELQVSYKLLRESEEQAKRLALYDHLTGLPNRVLFNERLNQAIMQAVLCNTLIALLFLDLDGFKAVNDNYGHSQGDLVLKEVAARLKLAVRNSDTVSRLGGDEYAIVLPGITTKHEVELIAEKITQAFILPFKLDHSQAKLTVSVGISLFPFDGDNLDSLLKNADDAMYAVKSTGKNGYKFHEGND